MYAEKHHPTGDHPIVTHDTQPLTIRMSEVVADVHMHEALRAHYDASLTGRSVRIHRANTSWVSDILCLALGGVLTVLYVIQGVMS